MFKLPFRKKTKEKKLEEYRKESEEYFKRVPVMTGKYDYEVNEEGLVRVFVTHETFYDKIAQRFFGVPPVTKLDLDEKGSYLLLLVDGKRTIQDFTDAMKEKYGESEAMYAGLFLAALEGTGVVKIQKPKA